jgi:hypothetical protein
VSGLLLQVDEFVEVYQRAAQLAQAVFLEKVPTGFSFIGRGLPLEGDRESL